MRMLSRVGWTSIHIHSTVHFPTFIAMIKGVATCWIGAHFGFVQLFDSQEIHLAFKSIDLQTVRREPFKSKCRPVNVDFYNMNIILTNNQCHLLELPKNKKCQISYYFLCIFSFLFYVFIILLLFCLTSYYSLVSISPLFSVSLQFATFGIWLMLNVYIRVF